MGKLMEYNKINRNVCVVSESNCPYDKDYFENGIVTGKSCYTNYRWMPEHTIKMAYSIIKYLGLDEGSVVLDYGCSKGYLVKALRILEISAYGCDVSPYAIEHTDADVREFCELITDRVPYGEVEFEWLLSKDVLEHVPEEEIETLLTATRDNVSKMFHVIPLGDSNGRFIIDSYHDDPTHITIREKEWWIDKFAKSGWELQRFDYKVSGIKDNWTDLYKEGNGFFTFAKV